MRIDPVHLLSAAVVLAWATATAQTSIVVPQTETSRDGNGIEAEPVAHDQVRHIHYLGAPLLNGMPQNVAITRIAYRRDAGVPGTLARRGRGTKVLPVWQIVMANFAGDPNTVAGTFPPPGTSGWSVVFAPKQVDFPDLPAPATLPGFDVVFPLDIPFPRTTTGLAIDQFAYENRGAVYHYYIDGVDSQALNGTVELISPTSLGCPSGQNRALGNAPSPGAGTLDLFLFGAEPGIAGMVNLGQATNVWGSLTLPLALTMLGMPQCFVYTDLVVQVPLATTQAGTAEVHLPTPAAPNLVGSVFYAQFFTRDTRVNPAVNLATSDGLKITMGSVLGGSNLPMSIVSAVGGLAQGRAGLVQYGRGPVVQLTW